MQNDCILSLPSLLHLLAELITWKGFYIVSGLLVLMLSVYRKVRVKGGESFLLPLFTEFENIEPLFSIFQWLVFDFL